jgi:hypothetical protein
MELFKDQRGKIKIPLDTTEDRIAAYMMKKIDDDKLQERDKGIMERWTQIIALLIKGHSPTQAVQVHMAISKRKGDVISRRTAYYDLKNATKIWGSTQDISYQANLQLLYEYCMKVFRLATKDRDLKAMNKAISEMREISKELNAIHAFDQDLREPSKFVLQILMNDQEEMTFDIDNYEIMPNEISKKVLDAVSNAQLSDNAFMKIVEESQNKA